MAVSNRTMIHKLQTAINNNGGIILIDRVQFYSKEQNRPVSSYKICTKVADRKQTLFKTSSQIQVVLFLRDYWFMMNGWEIPTDNEMWNEIKKVNGIQFSKE